GDAPGARHPDHQPLPRTGDGGAAVGAPRRPALPRSGGDLQPGHRPGAPGGRRATRPPGPQPSVDRGSRGALAAVPACLRAESLDESLRDCLLPSPLGVRAVLLPSTPCGRGEKDSAGYSAAFRCDRMKAEVEAATASLYPSLHTSHHLAAHTPV